MARVDKNQDKTKSRAKSNANLRPQKKGEPSHNPFGRPTKKESLTSLLKEVGEWLYPRDKNKLTFKEKLAVATYIRAIKGSSVSFLEVWNRSEGKLTQPIESTGPLTVVISDDYKPELEK